jgi:quaternary ammonium compound-resistance protein SugE
MNWLLLVIAGIFEFGWAIGLKYSAGFTRWWPSVWTLAAMLASFGLLGLAMRSMPVGTAYSVWVGIGTIGTVLLGALLFQEALTPLRLLSVMLILAGIIGLRLS